MNRRMLWLVPMLLAFSAPGVRAYTATGMGLMPCGVWTLIRGTETPPKMEAQQWVAGYLSGIRFVREKGADPLKGKSHDSVMVWIDDYCRASPNSPIMDAANAFYREYLR